MDATPDRPRAASNSRSASRAALLAWVVLLFALAGLTGTAMTLGLAAGAVQREPRGGLRARSLAETGISEKITRILAGDFGDLGSASRPIESEDGGYWVDVEVLDPSENLCRLTAHGACREGQESIEAVVRPLRDPSLQNAVYAGNSSGDPAYVLALASLGSEGDRIEGDVYSGNDVAVGASARVSGTIRARGRITGRKGGGRSHDPRPDFSAAARRASRDFDVARLFRAASSQESALGGRAGQVPEASPAHIFRRNPSDRAAWTDATEGDDYFLEDPWEALREDARSDGPDPASVTLSGASAGRGSCSEGRLYYVAGNLWIFNLHTNSIQLRPAPGERLAITIVVRGDIHVADNLSCRDREQDGLALIALADPARPGSGTIHLGDPADGTLVRVEACLYAENDIRGDGLDGARSPRLEIGGSLSAGNQLLLHLDRGRLPTLVTVNGDARLGTGRLRLPGIPECGGDIAACAVLSWRDVAAD